MKHTYYISGNPLSTDVSAAETFMLGHDTVLSQEYGDLTNHMKWSEQGFTILRSESFYEPSALVKDVEDRVKSIIAELSPETDLAGYCLEKYHHFVSDAVHHEVIKRTRRLFEGDFKVDINEIATRFSQMLNTPLRSYHKDSNSKQWTIVRINRPKSLDFNPAHKDIYEAYDSLGMVPRMINFWIPICGVNARSGLPLAPGSHKISESKILRTTAGSFFNGSPYSVNSILSWGGSSDLISMCPRQDELLMFSSHLIHGLAFNGNPDTTRVSLEFRLYEDA